MPLDRAACHRSSPRLPPAGATNAADVGPRKDYGATMARYEVNDAAVDKARSLIAGRQYVLESDWGSVQPSAEAGNLYLERHSWEQYAAWHLGLTVGANEETKARHAFVYGDFRRVHRTALIACIYRAAEWRHKQVELAAHRLLQDLDRAAGIT
jgi:hypothetical protein